MLLWKIVLFGSWFIIAFNYAGYAVIALIINKLWPFRGVPAASGAPSGREVAPSGHTAAPDDLPPLTFIVAAYNEAGCIREKIQNCLAQDYPASKVEWLFVTDGSSDETPSIVRGFPQVRLLHDDRRAGKSAALNRAVAAATHEIVVASDANTVLNPDALRLIARHYADPRVGGVAGEKKVVAAGGSGGEASGGSATGAGGAAGTTGGAAGTAAADAAGADASVGEGEGLYWKYESALKRIDSAFYSVVGAAGELFSFRRDLYTPVDPSIILDDFVISMRIAAAGYRIIYEPGACAVETPSFSMGDERKRKVRIAAGGFQSVALLRGAVSPWRYPRLYYLYMSHRVLRWVASPFCLVLSVAAGAVLALAGGPYVWLFALQAAFYALTVLPGKAGKLPRYFLFMNLSVLQGFMRWLRGAQPGAWEKARRA
jgi:cellulose synthase/poly-beta-1,6-N-acetylglucosamine synthase-like glycosyltransferase